VLMGDFSELFLNDQNIYPERLLKTGFSFKYANLNDALQ
ncbi:MAG TPA: epimerase, partial [Bacteroidales bacterium]|nr:epimerase [Bacteroidales bacterium]